MTVTVTVTVTRARSSQGLGQVPQQQEMAHTGSRHRQAAGLTRAAKHDTGTSTGRSAVRISLSISATQR